MAFGGESLVPLLLAATADPVGADGKTAIERDGEQNTWVGSEQTNVSGTTRNYAGAAVAAAGRKKTWAISQWPRRPSCVTHHNCLDGHGDPFAYSPDQAVMGYTLRVDGWRYTAWFQFNWTSTEPIWDTIVARELYTHERDTGDSKSGETFEFENLADNPTNKHVVDGLHATLTEYVKLGLVPPLTTTDHQSKTATNQAEVH